MRRSPLTIDRKRYSITWSLSAPRTPGRNEGGQIDTVINAADEDIIIWVDGLNSWQSLSPMTTAYIKAARQILEDNDRGVHENTRDSIVRERFGALCENYERLLYETRPSI